MKGKCGAPLLYIALPRFAVQFRSAERTCKVLSDRNSRTRLSFLAFITRDLSAAESEVKSFIAHNALYVCMTDGKELLFRTAISIHRHATHRVLALALRQTGHVIAPCMTCNLTRTGGLKLLNLCALEPQQPPVAPHIDVTMTLSSCTPRALPILQCGVE